MTTNNAIRPLDLDALQGDRDRIDVLPYPGLRPFKSSEERFFFGRAKHAAELVNILGREATDEPSPTECGRSTKGGHFVTVIGPSGCGKSSLLRARVIPDLHQLGLIARAGQLWVSAQMRPGNAPLAHLRDTLVEATRGGRPELLSAVDRAALKVKLHQGRPGMEAWLRERPLPLGHRLLLLVDQFEELFRYDLDPDEARDFVDLLVGLYAEPLEQVYVILTMRTDYLGDCARFRGLAETVNGTIYLIPPLSREELADAIAKPALEANGSIDDALVDRLIRDKDGLAYNVADGEDALPLVQHAMMWMWIRARERQERGPIRLTLADYESSQVEGIGKALSHHASQVLRDCQSLVPQGARHAEVLFRQLVQRDKSRYIRRPATVGEIIDSTRADVGADPTLTLKAMEFLVGRLARDDCGFVYVQTEGRAEGDIGDLTLASTLDIGHEALIRQWDCDPPPGCLKQWARQESDAADRLLELVKRAERGSADRRPLDHFELDYFERAWSEIRQLYAPGSVIQGQARPGSWISRLFLRISNWFRGLDDADAEASAQLPPEPWALRHLEREPGEEGASAQSRYAAAAQLLEESKQELRKVRRLERRRLLLRVGGVVGLVLLAIGAYLVFRAISDVRQRIAVNRKHVEITIDRGRDYGKYRDGPAYRVLVGEARKIAKQCDIALSWWITSLMRNDQKVLDYQGRVAVGLRTIYLDVADLHGIPGEPWPRASMAPTSSAPSSGSAGASSEGRALPAPPGNVPVPLSDTIYFEHEDAECVAMIDAAGALTVACSGDGPWKTVELGSDADKRRECYKRQNAQRYCDLADDELIRGRRIARLSYQSGSSSKPGALIVVTPGGAVYRCALGTGAAGGLSCAQDSDLSEELKEKGIRLRAVALDPGGRFLAALVGTFEPEEPCGEGNSDCRWKLRNDDWMKNRLVRVLLYGLGEVPASITRYSLKTDTRCNFPRDIVDSRIRLSEDQGLLLWLTTDSDALCEWKLPAAGAQSQDLDPSYFVIRSNLTSDLRMAVASPFGHRVMLFGRNRPMAVVDDTSEGCKGDADSANPCAKEIGQLSVAPIQDVAFVDADRLVASATGGSRAEVYLLRFGASETLKLDPPKELREAVTRLIPDRNHERVLGLATDQNGTPKHVVRWDLYNVERAQRVLLSTMLSIDPDGKFGQRRAEWRKMIEGAETGKLPSGLCPMQSDPNADLAKNHGREIPGLDPIARFSLPGSYQYVAVYERSAPVIYNRRSPEAAGDCVAEKPAPDMVTILNDQPFVSPLGGPLQVDKASLYCSTRDAKQKHKGCWLVMKLEADGAPGAVGTPEQGTGSHGNKDGIPDSYLLYVFRGLGLDGTGCTGP